MEIENIAFSGGGVKAMAFCGAIKVLEKYDLMKGIKRIIGTSAGSMIGLFLACGYTSDDLVNIIKERDFSNLKDNSSLMENVHRFVFYYGFYSGELLDIWIADHLEAKGVESEITFKEFYEKFEKDFIVTGTHLNKRETVYFSKDTTPELPVKTAVRISTSIPLFFEPIQLDGDIYVDGGLLCNYPIAYLEKHDPDMEKTLGFYALSSVETNPHRTISDVFHVIDLSLNAITMKADMATITTKHQKRTIIVNTKDVNSTDFQITEETKEKLFGRGYRCTKKFLKELLDKETKENVSDSN